MRILHIGKFYSPFFGGIERFNQELVEAKTYKASNEVFVLVHHHRVGLNTVDEMINGIHIRRVKNYGSLIYAPLSPSFIFEVDRAIKEFKPDLIHIHMPNVSAFSCLFLRRAKRIPWVVHWHSDVLGTVPDARIKIFYPLYRLFERAVLKKAHKVIATSPNYANSSKPLLSFKNKVSVIPLGIKKQNLINAPQKTNNSLKLLSIGRLTYYKGHDKLIAAVEKLKNSDIQLDIIGQGELKKPLDDLIKRLNLEGQVKIHEQVEDKELTEFLLKCDLVCLPSIERTEAFGLVILEAARAGKPSLVSDVAGSGMSWIVKHHKTGLISKVGNIDSLAQNLKYAYTEQDKLIEYGNAARLNFINKFDIELSAQKLQDVYELCGQEIFS